MTRHSEELVQTPVGALLLRATDDALVSSYWHSPARAEVPVEPASDHPVIAMAVRQLRGYFAGERTHFELPLQPEGTAFQQEVWRALLRIPYGETRSYAAIASEVGRPRAVRAVGLANGRNPLSIIVPCHRVIGADGTLTGYAGGLPAKQWLLSHERQSGLHPATRPSVLRPLTACETYTSERARISSM